MFGDGQYYLSIPVPQKIADYLQQLILGIVEKDPSLGVSKKLTSEIEVRSEFHITLGIFHPGVFKTNRGLFKHIINFLREHNQAYKELSTQFHGEGIIEKIGYEDNSLNLVKGLEKSKLIYAAVWSNEINLIRERIHALLKSSGVEDSHFVFTDPHITLFTKNSKDIHDIRKIGKISIKEFGPEQIIDFQFGSVIFQRGFKKLINFGDSSIEGKPTQSFSKVLKVKLNKLQSNEPKVNWGALFQDSVYRKDAKQIKEIILKHNFNWGAIIQELGKGDALAVKKIIM